MFECVVEVLKELDPAGLSVGDFLWVAEELKVAVISADTGGEGGA